VLDRGTWTPAPVFKLIASRGRVERAELERTFNMGVGMVAVLAPDDVDRALAVLTARHVPAWVVGEVHKSTAVPDNPSQVRVLLRGDHARF
jgi:phosphoribosylformylglycinamidine cyclo-ligase